MTTFFQFQPNTTTAFTFQPTLDGALYSATIVWNTWGQDWYLNLATLAGTQVILKAVRGSTNQINTPLTTTIGLNTASVGSSAGLTSGWAVNSVNATSGTTLSVVTAAGTVRLSQPALVTGTDANAIFSFDIDLLGGLGFTSTLVYRTSSQQFEVSP